MAALNIRPINLGGNIRPINPMRGGNIRPVNNNLRSNPINKRKTAFDSIDINEIGQGHMMTEGSYHKQFGVKKYRGLKGQLMKMKWAGRRGVTKNLSEKDVGRIHDLIADRIKSKKLGSNVYISRKEKNSIMRESRKMVKDKDSDFTWEDRKDLKTIINTMQKKYKDKILHRGDNTDTPSVATESQTSLDNRDAANAQPINMRGQSGFARRNGLLPKVDSNNPSVPPGGVSPFKKRKEIDKIILSN